MQILTSNPELALIGGGRVGRTTTGGESSSLPLAQQLQHAERLFIDSKISIKTFINTFFKKNHMHTYYGIQYILRLQE